MSDSLEPLILYFRRGRIALVFFVFLIVFIVLHWIATECLTTNKTIPAIIFFFFDTLLLLKLIVLFFNLTQKKPGIILDAHGIHDNMTIFNYKCISWGSIKTATINKSRKSSTSWLTIRFTPTPEQRNFLRTASSILLCGFGFYIVGIPSYYFPLPLHEIKERIDAFIAVQHHIEAR